MFVTKRSVLFGCSGSIMTALLFAAVTGCGDMVDETGGAEATRGRMSQCGPTWDGDPVERLSNDLLVSGSFVNRHSPAVGYLTLGCSGTLISDNLFLTAGHCRDHLRPDDQVLFNYQNDPNGNPRATRAFNIEEVVEAWNGGLDYAILRLQGHPGTSITPAAVATSNCQQGKDLAIIGHPMGRPKEVATGHVANLDSEQIYYGDLDTLGGNSGSGILCAATGKLTGVHAWGGCHVYGDGANSGTHIEALLAASPTLQGLISPCAPKTVRMEHAGWWVQVSLPKATWGKSISFHDGAHGGYKFPLCRRIRWRNLNFTCEHGQWRQSGDLWTTAHCAIRKNTNQPYLTVGYH